MESFLSSYGDCCLVKALVSGDYYEVLGQIGWPGFLQEGGRFKHAKMLVFMWSSMSVVHAFCTHCDAVELHGEGGREDRTNSINNKTLELVKRELILP
eukprot:scaffold2924_cov165-Ochromonas_danica.AAC.4